MLKFLKRQEKIILIFIFALVLRLALSFWGTLKLDQNTFIAWSNILIGKGFSNFYNSWSDYLPGYPYLLWLLGKINSLSIIPPILLYKIPAILADVLTGLLIYKIVKKYKDEKWGIVISSFYFFNPAILANSTFWGQIDSLTALTSLLTLYLIEINPFFSAVSLSLGTLIKPQVAFIFPVIFLLMLKDKWSLKKIFSYLFIGLALFLLGFLPFVGKQNFLNFLLERFNISLNQYPYTSINAFNFWGIFGFWRPDSLGVINPQILGFALTGVISLVFLLKMKLEKGKKYLAAAVIFLVSFLFLTRMHERHLLPTLAPLLVASSLNTLLLIPYFFLSLIYVANLFYASYWINHNFVSVFPNPLIIVFILFNLASLIFIFLAEFKKGSLEEYLRKFKSIFKFNLKQRKLEKISSFPKVNLKPKTTKIFLVLILAFAFITRLISLGEIKKEYFDEVYHAFTARQILHGNPKAWEWWNTPPEGFAYEWTHPPLAKLGMVLGMLVFGENSFGWRFPGVVLGAGSVFLVYLIAKEIFRDEILGLLSAATFSLDGLPLVMSRIGMNDGYLLLFALLSIYFFLKKKNLPSALSWGLAISSKWSALWVIPIFGFIWLTQRKDFKLSYLWFLILPPMVYLATYLPLFLTGHSWGIFVEMQKQMWWYHTNLRATHPYTSPWWSWPLLVRPIYLYTSNEVGGWVARIYAMGNPLIFWGGIVSFVFLGYWALEKRLEGIVSYEIKNIGLVIFSYLIFFVPWAASPRIMFLYHYLPSLPFLSIAIAYVLRRNLKLIFLFLPLAFLTFLYFYPHWAGIKIPLWLDSSYYWFTSWR